MPRSPTPSSSLASSTCAARSRRCRTRTLYTTRKATDSRVQEQDRLLSIAWEQFRPDTSGLAGDPAPTSGSQLLHSSIVKGRWWASRQTMEYVCVRPLAKVKVQDIQNALATRGMTANAYESLTSTTLWCDCFCFAEVADMPDGFLAALNKDSFKLKRRDTRGKMICGETFNTCFVPRTTRSTFPLTRALLRPCCQGHSISSSILKLQLRLLQGSSRCYSLTTLINWQGPYCSQSFSRLGLLRPTSDHQRPEIKLRFLSPHK